LISIARCRELLGDEADPLPDQDIELIRRHAYYHCRPQCRAVNISKATLEGAFVDELALLQPTPRLRVPRKRW
jgi:hypothetical protein